MFQGFDRKAVELLRVLPSFDAGEYGTHRDLVADRLVKPGGDLISMLARRLEVGPPAPRTSVSPLHTDLRFAPAGAPRYKNHLLLTAWNGPDKKTGTTFWLRLEADAVTFAVGVTFTPETRDRWRQAVGGEEGEELAGELEALAERYRDHRFEISGDLLKKPPPPWEESHPRADLLRRTTTFQVRFTESLPWELVDQPDLAAWCGERLEGLLPVYRWLVVHLVSRRARTGPTGPS